MRMVCSHTIVNVAIINSSLGIKIKVKMCNILWWYFSRLYSLYQPLHIKNCSSNLHPFRMKTKNKNVNIVFLFNLINYGWYPKRTDVEHEKDIQWLH